MTDPTSRGFRRCAAVLAVSLACVAHLAAAAPHATPCGFSFPKPSLPSVPVPNVPSLPSVPGVPVPDVHVPSLSLPIPSLPMLQSGDPITSSFADAVTSIPFLDDYHPIDTVPMVTRPVSDDGVYRLLPGSVYDMPTQSYCLHAGTYSPHSGLGYVYAPLKGPEADVIRHILTRSGQHPDLAQEKVQYLIWALLARTPFTNMNSEMQQTATTLLTPKELITLNASALGVIPNSSMGSLLGSLPDPLQQIYTADNNIRSMIETTANMPYDQLERVAVLKGDPPHQKGLDVPSGRWSFYPGSGMFIRYLPSSYQHTLEEVSVPGRHRIERDALGRIASILDANGNQLRVTYDDSTASIKNGKATAYTVSEVDFKANSTLAQNGSTPADAIWRNAGFTIVGPLPKSWAGSNSGYADIGAVVADEHSSWHEIVSALNQSGVKLREDSIDPATQNLLDLTHLLRFLGKANGASPQAYSEGAFALVTEAWEDAYASIVRPSQTAQLSASMAHGGRRVYFDGNGAGYDPSGGVAMPADPSRQRLAQSPRPNSPFQNVGDSPFGSAVQAAAANNGIPPQDVAGYQDGDGNWHYMVRVGHDGNALPTQDTVTASGTSGNEVAKDLVFVFVQQNGSEGTKVSVHSTDVETGVVDGAGTGRSSGTDSNSVTQATNQAFGNMGSHRP